MKPISKKTIGFVILFALTAIVVAKASVPYSISVKSKNTEEYPRVILEMSISGEQNNYYARDFKVIENEERNIGPMVLLSPSILKDSVELRVLLDNSGNTKRYEEIIKSNIKALVEYIDSQVSSFRLIINTIGGGETSISINSVDTLYQVDGISFSDTPTISKYDFSKIDNLVAGSPVSSEKIALIINGGRFHVDNERASLRSATSALASNGYKTFVYGHPTSSLYPLKPDNIHAEDISLFRDVQGGFMGTFNADLSIIYDLIKKTYSGNSVMHYYTNNPPESGGISEIYIDDYKVETISLPAPGLERPTITSGLSSGIDSQGLLSIDLRIKPESKMINGVMMKFHNGEGPALQGLIRDRGNEGADNLYAGKINIPESIVNSFYDDEYTGKYIRYFITAHTPYAKITTEDSPASIPILLYDEGITFYSQSVNNGNQIIWNWDKIGAKKFEVWKGNTKIRSADSEKKIILDTDGCNRYPIIKVRASNVSNPGSYDWGYFSKPMEIFVGQDSVITEWEAIDIMMNCIDLDKREVSSLNSLINNDPEYSSDSNLTTERMLHYLTGIVQGDVRDEIVGQKYSLLYYIMNFISNSEYDLYKDGEVKKSVLYKLITNINQINDLSERFDLALHELSIRLLGSSAI